LFGYFGNAGIKTGMEKEMKELYIEGLAIHDDPESCAGIREGGGEVLTGARAGWAIEPRKSKQRSGVPTLSKCAEGNIAGGVMREPSADPAWSKTLSMVIQKWGLVERPGMRLG
jgi:hypothetical protein